MAEAEEEASNLQKKNMANFVWHKFVTIKFGKRETRRGKERGAGGETLRPEAENKDENMEKY